MESACVSIFETIVLHQFGLKLFLADELGKLDVENATKLLKNFTGIMQAGPNTSNLPSRKITQF